MKRNRIAISFLSAAALIILTACPVKGDLPEASPTPSPAVLSLDPLSCTIAIGSNIKLSALLDGTTAEASQFVWSSADPQVATVSADGLVTAGIVGTTTITVKTADGSQSLDCALTVSTFFAGYYNDGAKNNACYWENDTFHSLVGDLTGTSCALSPMASYGGRIYTAGIYWDGTDSIPCYWEDSARHDLEAPGTIYEIDGITVADGIVYVTGSYYDSVSNTYVPCYWEGDTLHMLRGEGGNSFASWVYTRGITVYDGTVYVSGQYNTSGIYASCYWEGSTFHDLERSPGNMNNINGIAVSEGTVYVVGAYHDGAKWSACYWENESLRSFGPASSDSIAMISITVSAGTVYAAGYSSDGSTYIPCYYEGQTLHPLGGNPSNYAVCSEIVVSGGTVYTAGVCADGSLVVPCYWEGTTFHKLSGDGSHDAGICSSAALE